MQKDSQILAELYTTLQKLIGLHRQLLDIVRLERDALTQADIKAIEETMLAKQGAIEAIRHAEAVRVQIVRALAEAWQTPAENLTLSQIAIHIQGEQLKFADQLRSAYNTLKIMIDHVRDQNAASQDLLEKSLAHIEAMKKNVLGEADPNTSTYTAAGQKTTSSGGARLLSQEA